MSTVLIDPSLRRARVVRLIALSILLVAVAVTAIFVSGLRPLAHLPASALAAPEEHGAAAEPRRGQGEVARAASTQAARRSTGAGAALHRARAPVRGPRSRRDSPRLRGSRRRDLAPAAAAREPPDNP